MTAVAWRAWIRRFRFPLRGRAARYSFRPWLEPLEDRLVPATLLVNSLLDTSNAGAFTLPEREGWVDRNKLLDFNGRSRKPQMALAAQYDFKEYAQPAGGCCFLTNEQYSHKLADLWTTRGTKHYELDDIMLLKVGRHLRPRPNFKLIVGRDEGENNFLHGYRKRFTHLCATSHEGPLVLIDGNANDEDIELAARLTARFGKGRESEAVTLTVTDTTGNTREITVTPLTASDIPAEWYL